MARIVVVGGGVIGLCGALMLQRDGHDVSVLERDPHAPGDPGRAWEEWERRGVTQFRHPHGLLARATQIISAELPDVATGLVDAGAYVYNIVDALPQEATGGRRGEDDRFTIVTGRRPLVEAAVARTATAAGLDVRRGLTVRGLLADRRHDGRADVRGIVTDTGDTLTADLVIDAGGRRSALPAWLRDAGAPGPVEEIDDCGFVYYARHFRSADGSIPPLRGPVLQAHGSISTATLAADHGTWSVLVFTSSRDESLRGLRHESRWTAVVRACPLVSHWIDAEPITGVDVMTRIEDRRRHYVLDGRPVALGVVPLGDAWVSTNPSIGRGISLGLMQAVAVREALRQTTDREDVPAAWHRLIQERIEPYVLDTFAFDRHRLSDMQAAAEGQTYVTEDPGWTLGQALRRAALRDPDLLRDLLAVIHLHQRGVDVLGRPGAVAKVLALDPGTNLPGPDREELVRLVTRERTEAAAS
jgi:2-polyprenyl-6-methoxyphenol hydroxylase-like FAD-dependent oxidoreductase